jgi:hypothetical protein
MDPGAMLHAMVASFDSDESLLAILIESLIQA